MQHAVSCRFACCLSRCPCSMTCCCPWSMPCRLPLVELLGSHAAPSWPLSSPWLRSCRANRCSVCAISPQIRHAWQYRVPPCPQLYLYSEAGERVEHMPDGAHLQGVPSSHPIQNLLVLLRRCAHSLPTRGAVYAAAGGTRHPGAPPPMGGQRTLRALAVCWVGSASLRGSMHACKKARRRACCLPVLAHLCAADAGAVLT